MERGGLNGKQELKANLNRKTAQTRPRFKRFLSIADDSESTQTHVNSQTKENSDANSLKNPFRTRDLPTKSFG